ncbi:MAG TPA: matrixin family metalloprotease [Abditibacterium sp.]
MRFSFRFPFLMQFPSRFSLFLGLGAALMPAFVVGCGGGGGGSGPSTPGATATPRPTSMATPAPTRVAGTCNASDFQPNYVPSVDVLQHWRGFPLKIYLEPTDARTRALTLRGFDQWVTATGNRVRYNIVDSAAGADITVTFDLNRGSERLGQATTYFFEGQNEIERAEIEFSYYAFDARPDAEEVNQSVAAHEFGHALGIQGHSPSDADLMFGRATGGLENVTTRDLNTLRTAYCDNFPTASTRAIRRQQGVLKSYTISLHRDAMGHLSCSGNHKP